MALFNIIASMLAVEDVRKKKSKDAEVQPKSKQK